jgi:hypothetical protein
MVNKLSWERHGAWLANKTAIVTATQSVMSLTNDRGLFASHPCG